LGKVTFRFNSKSQQIDQIMLQWLRGLVWCVDEGCLCGKNSYQK